MFLFKAMISGLTGLGLLFGSMAAGMFPSEDTIVITSEDGAWEMKVNDDALYLDTNTLVIGDARSFVLEDGRELVVTRTENGLQMALDGEVIDIGGDRQFSFVTTHGDHDTDVIIGEKTHDEIHIVRKTGAHGAKAVFVGDDGEDHNVFFSSGDIGHWIDINDANRVTISGLDDLDADARARIQNLLTELGVEKDVVFREKTILEANRIQVHVDPDGADDHEPKVIFIEHKKEKQDN